MPARAKSLAFILAPIALAMTLAGAAEVKADPKGFCPPGLAKKGACGYRDYEHRHGRDHDYRRGERIVEYRIIRYDRYDLRRPRRGEIYVETGGRVYLLAEATQRVIEAINLFDAATN